MGVHVLDGLLIEKAFLRLCPIRSTYSCSWPMGWESGIRGFKISENEEIQCSSAHVCVANTSISTSEQDRN